MSNPEKKKRRKRFAKEELAIRKIIHDWGPIGSPAPEDEYDCLVHHILSVLHTGGKKQDVATKLKSELENHFGLGPVSKKRVSATADKVWKWWQKISGCSDRD